MLPLSAAAIAQTTAPQDVSGGARTAAASTNAGGVSAEALVQHVIANLDAQNSIAAKVRQRVNLLNRPLVGTGVYLQQGRGANRAFRLDLDLMRESATQAAQGQGSLRHVCDGRTLWLSKTLGNDATLVRVDVARLNRARPKSAPAAPPLNLAPSLGGLPKLLANIDNAFAWGPIFENRLEDVRVWSLEGRWKPERLVQLLPDQKDAIETGKPVNLKKLAPNLPERVVLHIGIDDGFPYRIEYWKSDPKAKPDAPESGKLVALVEFYEVRLGGQIDPLQFAFDPKGAQAVDRTGEYLERLGLEEVSTPDANRGAPRRR